MGGLVGALLAPRLTTWAGVGRMLVVGGIVFPASVAVVAVADGPVWTRVGLLAVSEFLSGFGVMVFDINLARSLDDLPSRFSSPAAGRR